MTDTGPSSAQRERILTTTVFIDGANRPFGELRLEQIRARADELRSAAGWGPMARVVPVALAWRELAAALERGGAGTVAELPPDLVAEMAPKLWVVPPGGGLLS